MSANIFNLLILLDADRIESERFIKNNYQVTIFFIVYQIIRYPLFLFVFIKKKIAYVRDAQVKRHFNKQCNDGVPHTKGHGIVFRESNLLVLRFRVKVRSL